MQVKHFFIFCGAAFVALVGYACIRAGYYPALLVNGTPVSARFVAGMLGVAETYYGNVSKTYGGAADGAALRALERAALGQIVGDTLVRQELTRRMKAGELAALVAQKIDPFVKDAEFQKKVAVLYGVPFGEYRDRFLIPEARREILEGRLVFEKADFGAWLAAAEKNAHVLLFYPGFSWRDGAVE